MVEAGKDYLQVNLAMPCLGERGSESWPMGADQAESFTWSRRGDWWIAEAGDLLWVCALGNAEDEALESVTGKLYCDLFAILGESWRLQRIWHYLPRINEPGAQGLERYRAFCRGRSVAFESVFGKGFHACLPAASAVGCQGDRLVIYGCARRNAVVRYFENPLQIPAYRYSQEYGPRAPGFARASLTHTGGGAQPIVEETGEVAAKNARETAVEKSEQTASCSESGEVYISGTASIRDERSLVDIGILGQLNVTVENLNRIAAECGLQDFLMSGGCDLGAGLQETTTPCVGTRTAATSGVGASEGEDAEPLLVAKGGRRFKVYLRNARDYEVVSHHFGALLNTQDEVIYLCSDICRTELDLEIEVSLIAKKI